jgi:hypothetical protein
MSSFFVSCLSYPIFGSGVEEVMNYVPVILSRSPERSEGSAKNLLL